MKILFDHQQFYFTYGGASKYFTMLIDALPQECWATTTLLCSNEYVRSKELWHTIPYYFRGQTRLLERMNRPYTNYLLRHQNFDVFHQTNFGTYCFNALGTKPMVTTYHDINLSTIDPHPEIVERQKRSLERADAIICVSENTKEGMLKYFDVDERKVHVVYHGIELPNRQILPQHRIFDFRYVLYVGLRSAYKNFDRFVQAFALLRQQHPELHLICTAPAFSPQEIERFRQLEITDCTHALPATEEQMSCLYRDAEVFAFPSLYEGFGMPILEAWSLECPVVLSHASCFPEIAGDAGVYFNPESAEDICNALQHVIEDTTLRHNLIQRGNERIKAFSWQRCAEEHMRVYRSLL